MNVLNKSLTALLVCAPLLGFAAEPPAPPADKHDMAAEMMGGGEHERHKGMRCKEKGKCCQGMGKEMGMGMGMGMHPPGPMVMIPQLPPGNEKQQLQMQAEIQQKVGEIVSKYAGQLP